MRKTRKIVSLVLAFVLAFSFVASTLGSTRVNAAAAKSYTVSFVDWDGGTLATQSVARGKNATPPADPTREGYIFTGWDGSYTKVTADVTVTALYEEDPNGTAGQHQVLYLDWDNSVISEQYVQNGGAAVTPADPVREGYTFTGWDSTISDWIVTDMQIKALYTINSYSVKFVADGATVEEQTVEYGSAATAPTAPTKEGYTFTGWDKAFNNVTSDLTVNAVYTINTYTVSFVDWDDSALGSATVNYGGAATAPADPTREGYTFTGWDKAFDNVKSDLTVKAQYSLNSYTVTFVDYDNTVLKEQTVFYGADATAPAAPVRTGYTFVGWSGTYTNVKSNLTITANYDINSYTITFVTGSGNFSKAFDYGTTPAITDIEGASTDKAATAQYTYTFTGWDKTIVPVTEAATYTAVYSQTVNNYTVTFVDYDNTVLKTQTVAYGGNATAPTAPTRDGYDFAGWNGTYTGITGNVTITATYTEKVVDHFIGIKDERIGVNIAPDADIVETSYVASWNDLGGINNEDYEEKSYLAEDVDAGADHYAGWGHTAPSETLTYTWYTPVEIFGCGIEFWYNQENAPHNTNGVAIPTSYVYEYLDEDGNWVAIKDKHEDDNLGYGVEEDGINVTCFEPITTRVLRITMNKQSNSVSGLGVVEWEVYADSEYVYTPSTTPFTVTFVDWDGTPLKVEEVYEGEDATPPTAPTRSGYSFASWDTDYTDVHFDITVTATYFEGERIADNIAPLASGLTGPNVASWQVLGAVNDKVVGQSSYSGENNLPEDHYGSWGTTTDHDVITYTWSDYYAIEGSGIQFWYNLEGAPHGNNGICIPENYKFEYLDPDTNNWVAVTNADGLGIEEDIINMTTFDEIVTKSFRITMYKTSSSNYGLGVIEWEVYGTPATLDRKTVKFVDYNGTVLKEQRVNAGGAATAPTAPTRTGYTFTGWDKAFNNVTEDITVTATYAINKYTIKFVDYDDTVISSAQVNYNTNPTVPADPSREGYAFAGWDKTVVPATADATYKATYTEVKSEYNVTFVDYDGTTVFETIIVPAGGDAVPTVTPSRTGYTFTGWSIALTNINTDCTAVAQYSINKYTVTFADYNGTTLKSQEVEYGGNATPPANPTRDGYTFTGWQGTYTGITGNVTIVAQYEESVFLPVNIAPDASSISAPQCATWEDVSGINDRQISATSYEANSNTHKHFGSWGFSVDTNVITYNWDQYYEINGCGIEFWYDDNNGQHNASGVDIPESYTYEYLDINTNKWVAVPNATGFGIQQDILNQTSFDKIVTNSIRITMKKKNATNYGLGVTEWEVYGQLCAVQPTTTTTTRPTGVADPDANITSISGGYKMVNDYFYVETGSYGQLTALKIQGDSFDTNYIITPSNTSGQSSAAGHQWMGELMFKVKVGNATSWSEQNTGRCTNGRTVEVDSNNKKVVVTYQNASATNGINKFKLVESYQLRGNQLHWEMTATNTNSQNLTIGDWGVPLAFNEYWTQGDAIYETRCVDHSFVALNGSYVYATRPSGIGKFLLLMPDETTGAKFEYQDHWRTNERAADEKNWCQDQSNWQNGLNVFYIHSNVIKSTKRGYLPNTQLVLAPGESKTYAFNFTVVQDENDMKTALYNDNIIDAVAVPGMTYSVNMPGKVYLHTKYPASDISFTIQCPHETGLHAGNQNTVNNNMAHTKTDANTHIDYLETVEYDGQQYHIYELHFKELGQHNVYINYDGGTKQSCLQFYMMDDANTALNLHANFMVNKTQINDSSVGNKAFDDWMMDNKTVRANVESGYYWTQTYWGWGDDWGLTHGTFLAEKNVYTPVATQIQALDDYLTTCIWGSLMNGHHSDYKINDFLVQSYVQSGASTLCYRGYAYPHIYNTYFAMYKIAKRYPNMIVYDEKYTDYLLKAYNIMKALYGSGVSYNWSTGVMGEMTTPDIIQCLKDEGYTSNASTIEGYMKTKYSNFKGQTYPYGSEYSYDNTGEEAVYTLAKMNYAANTDVSNAKRIMKACDLKTRACRGLQPIWYRYSVPVTNCGENWWQFQYTIALAGYIMDDYLRYQDNGWSDVQRALMERRNYAAKIASLTVINSGQMDADSANVGTVGWTYQSEMGNLGGQGTGGGKLHNGWRQMAGEADLNLWGAMRYLSSDVAVDPVFGLFGYGCTVTEASGKYTVTPLDGLYTRLNFIDTKLSIELKRDQYTQAVVAKDNTSVQFTMKNIESTAHSSDIVLTGLAAGTYTLKVNGTQQSTFTVASAKANTTVSVNLPAAASCTVVISK